VSETPETPSRWQSRIVGSGEANPESLLANEANWRVHPKEQQDALADVLDDVGWVQQIIVNRRTSDDWQPGERGVETVVDGHLRVSLALRRGEPMVPVLYVDLSPDEERLILATIDPISALAVADADKLAGLLDGLTVEGAAVEAMLASLAASEGIGEPSEEDDRGDLLALTQATLGEPEHTVHTRDVWRVGHHTLICIDVLVEWETWTAYLERGMLFCPYPGPMVPLTERATTTRCLLVQPEPYIAGHLLDRYVEIHGPGSVAKIEDGAGHA